MSGAASILTGLLSGMNEGGGTHQLARLLAQKVGRYDPYNDPLFFQDLQRASQLGEAGKSHFLNEYQPYMRYNIPQGAMGPVKMTDSQKWNQLTGTMYENPMFNLRDTLQQYDPLGDYSWVPNINVPYSQFKDMFGHNLLSANKEMQFSDAKTYAEYMNAYANQQLGNSRQADANYTNSITDPTVKKINQEAFANEMLGKSRQADADYTTALIDPTVYKINQEGYAAQQLGDSRNADARLTNKEADLYDLTVDLGAYMGAYNMPGAELFNGKDIALVALEDALGINIGTLDLDRGKLDSEIYSNTKQGNMYQSHGNLYDWQSKLAQATFPYDVNLAKEKWNTQQQETAYKKAQTNRVTMLTPLEMDEIASRINANDSLAYERDQQGNYYAKKDPNPNSKNNDVYGLTYVTRTSTGKEVFRTKDGLLTDSKGNPVLDSKGQPLMMDNDGKILSAGGFEGLKFQKTVNPVTTKQYDTPLGPSTPQGKSSTTTTKAQSSEVVNALYQLFGTTNKAQILNYLGYATPDVKKSFQNDWGWTYEEILALLRK